MALWNNTNTFAGLSGSQPASKLDTNFNELAIMPQYTTSAAGTNTYTMSSPLTFAAYLNGMTFMFICPNTNTSSTVTLNVNGVGAVSVYKNNNYPLDVGDLQENGVYIVYYDGTNFMLANPTLTPYAWRNYCINGNMAIDQRNETSFSASGTVEPATTRQYISDRWFIATTSGGGALSGAYAGRQQVSASEMPEAYFVSRMGRTAGTSAFTSAMVFGQVIDTNNSYQLRGKTITLSFWVKAGANYSPSTVTASVVTGTTTSPTVAALLAGTWTGQATAGSTVVTPSTSVYRKYFLTVNIPSNAFSVAVKFQTASFSGTAGAADYLDISLVQLEVGSLSSLFEERTYATELAMCQMFYQKTYNRGVSVASSTIEGARFGRYSASTGAHFQLNTSLRTNMRSVPTTTWYPVNGIAPTTANEITDNYTATTTTTVTSTSGEGTTSTGYPNTAAVAAGNIVAAHYTVEWEY